MLLLSIQTPSQPKSFFGVSLVAVCDWRSNAQSAGNGPSQSLRPDSSPTSMLKSNSLPSGATSIRPAPLISTFCTMLLIFHCARIAPTSPFCYNFVNSLQETAYRTYILNVTYKDT